MFRQWLRDNNDFRTHAGSNLFVYDTVAMTWALVTAASGTPPSSRVFHGFTESGGKLYVHGGYKSYGMQFNSRQLLL